MAGPRTVGTLGSPADREINALWEAIDALQAAMKKLGHPAPAPAPALAPQPNRFAGLFTVREVDGVPSIEADAIEFDQADGFQVSEDGGAARIDRLATTTAPADVTTGSANAGTATQAANADHVHHYAAAAATLGTDFAVITVDTALSATPTKRYIRVINASGKTLTLPDPAVHVSAEIFVSQQTGTGTIAPHGGENIDGAAVGLSTQASGAGTLKAVGIISDGTNWWTFARSYNP